MTKILVMQILVSTALDWPMIGIVVFRIKGTHSVVRWIVLLDCSSGLFFRRITTRDVTWLLGYVAPLPAGLFCAADQLRGRVAPERTAPQYVAYVTVSGQLVRPPNSPADAVENHSSACSSMAMSLFSELSMRSDVSSSFPAATLGGLCVG